MIYYNKDDIIIRNMEENDTAAFVSGEVEQGWHAEPEKYRMRLLHQKLNRSIALSAEYMGNVAGYVNIYFDAKDGSFANKDIPEIVDLGVLEKYQQKGIGAKLMDIAEQIASEHSDIVYLAVGLHSGYGSAQRMYVKRGYIPDGTGVWYGNSVCEQYAPCNNDDDLVIYMSKKLK